MADDKKVHASKWGFDPVIAEEICFIVSTTKDKIDKILQSDKRFPRRDVFYRWLFEEPTFGEMYSLAKERQQDLLVEGQDEYMDWAQSRTFFDDKGNEKIDTGAIALAKLRCESVRWAAGRLAPRKYGEKIHKDTTVTVKHEDVLKNLK